MRIKINGRFVCVTHNPFNILWRTRIKNVAEGLDVKLKSGLMCEEEGKDFIESFFSNEPGGYYNEEAVPVCLKVAEHFRDAGEDKKYWNGAISDLRRSVRNSECRKCIILTAKHMLSQPDDDGLKEYA